jgi:hypothetical protein
MLKLRPIRASVWIIGSLLAASIILNFVQLARLDELRRAVPATDLDRPFIERAAAYWGNKNGSSPKQAMRERYARVIYMGKETCVSLQIEIGGVGGVPVYCFDTETKQLTRKFDDVE